MTGHLPINEAPDGTYSSIKGGNIVLNTVQNMTQDTILVNSSRVVDHFGHRLNWQEWSLSADMEYVLFKTDYVKQWRHSSSGNYWVYQRSTGLTTPVLSPTTPPTITLCSWSPVSHSLAFVSANDLYVIPASAMASSDRQAIRVTNDGSAVVFNGAADWVYEEEVFGSNAASWWSPDGQTLAYLRSDETPVHDYAVTTYNPSDDAFRLYQYPSEQNIK